ncbi:hypothetical protein H4582DRAFT_2130008 [Lactarius indigo]|nr:hypothetical protein H4582DRAFT_2130008 [Lactarius indigo]
MQIPRPRHFVPPPSFLCSPPALCFHLPSAFPLSTWRHTEPMMKSKAVTLKDTLLGLIAPLPLLTPPRRPLLDKIPTYPCPDPTPIFLLYVYDNL